jgi:hypothetical protein
VALNDPLEAVKSLDGHVVHTQVEVHPLSRLCACFGEQFDIAVGPLLSLGLPVAVLLFLPAHQDLGTLFPFFKLAGDQQRVIRLEQRDRCGVQVGENRHLDRPGQVLDRDKTHPFAQSLFGDYLLEAADNPANTHLAAVGLFCQVDDVTTGKAPDVIDVAVQRMAGDQEAEGLFFVGQFFLVVPFRHDGQFHSAMTVAPGHLFGAEQGNLGTGALFLDLLAVIGGSFQPLHQ